MLALGLLLVSSAAATDQQIQACAAIRSPVDRLTCFDGLASGPVAPPARGMGRWKVSTTKSAMDDSQTVVAQLRADAAINSWPSKVTTPTLIVRCQENRTEAYIDTGAAPAVEYGNTDGATTRVRIDSQKATQVHMGKSTDGEALFFPNSVGAVKQWLGKSTMTFQFTPFNSSPQVATFQLSGVDAAVEQIRKVCRW